MRIAYTKNFNEQLREINDKKLAERVIEVVKEVELAKSPWHINSLKKLKGHKAAYRIRRGNYRIGVFIENGEVTFAAIGLRKDIYNKFP